MLMNSMPLRLSRRQAGDADRVGGVELMVLWPDTLGPEDPADLGDDCEREATAREKAEAERLVRASCDEHGLVPVHVRVARIHRPIEPKGYRLHLAITIIGRRWVHASAKSRGRVAFAREG